MNGVNGAMSSVTTYRHSCSVASAAGSPAQNRRRERRTYQFDRSSTYAESRRPAFCVSYAASASSTSRASRCASESAHRSSAERSAAGGAAVVVGSKPASRA